jgi:hypothetical protein
MKWRIFLNFVLGCMILGVLTLIAQSYCAPQKKGCQLAALFGKSGVRLKQGAGSGVIGKWKITLADKGELYYLFAQDRSIVQTDKKTYEAAHIVPQKKAHAAGQSVDIEKAIDALSTYLKELKQPSSLSAMEELEKGL